MQTSNVFSVIATSLTVVLNLVGLKLLHDIPSIKETQKVLLSHLSISDTLNAITALTGSVIIRQVLTKGQADAFKALAAHCILTSSEALIIITIDRVIATAMPFRYKIIVTKRRLIIVIIAVWVISLTTMTVLMKTSKISRIHEFTFLITSPTEVIIFISYVYISLKIRKSRKKSTADASSSSTRRGKKMILVSSCIVLSFAIFVAIPDIVLYVSYKHENILIWIIQIYYIINPIIYIYCYPSLREKILTKLREIRRPFIGIQRVQVSSAMEHPQESHDDKTAYSLKEHKSMKQ